MKNTHHEGVAPELLDTRQLLAFKTIVETGGFTKAARQLHLTQSALSHQIKTLETQLQTQVFLRVGKRVTLTQAGEVLLRYAIFCPMCCVNSGVCIRTWKFSSRPNTPAMPFRAS